MGYQLVGTQKTKHSLLSDMKREGTRILEKAWVLQLATHNIAQELEYYTEGIEHVTIIQVEPCRLSHVHGLSAVCCYYLQSVCCYYYFDDNTKLHSVIFPW
jgi:hypothetical protein